MTLLRWLALVLVALTYGCATYVTPGAGVSIQNLAKADADIAELMKVEPAAAFPARVAVARVQASGYSSKTNQCYGSGKYCVVTTRDIEPEASFDRMGKLPQIAGLAVMNRLLLPPNLHSINDLRRAAATLKTDMLLVYSVDTGFHIDNTDVGPLALVTLGFLPTKKARVTSTVSAVIFDVRTGFVYGTAEATVMEEQRATTWSSEDAIDSGRRAAEASAFQRLVSEIEKLWGRVLATHAPSRPAGG